MMAYNSFACLLVFVAVANGASMIAMQQTPVNGVNLTVYHVNQINYTGITNMNSADTGGDAFFKFRTILTRQLCQDPHSPMHYPGMCTNPEQFATDLIASKVVLSVNPAYGKYSECNVCTNGTIPFTRPPKRCEYGTYACNCNNFLNVCPPSVGKENVTEMFTHFMRPGMSRETNIYLNLVERTGGFWYSTLEAGECGNPKAKTCDWALIETVKRINATCLDATVDQALYKAGASCFSNCGSQAHNTSAPCYAQCYYDTLLGTEAGTTVPCTGGFTREQIDTLWDDAFESCPSI